MSVFRVFGVPYTLSLHQHVTYLRLKLLPYKVYCTSFTTTLLYMLYYRAKGAICTQAPNGLSYVQVWQLAAAVEMGHSGYAAALAPTTLGMKASSDRISTTSSEVKNARTTPSDEEATTHGTERSEVAGKARVQRMMLNKRTHPQLHLACCMTVLYSGWWLPRTGSMYRWILGENLDVIENYSRFFYILSTISPVRTFAPLIRQAMNKVLLAYGICKLAEPFMDEHFHRMCASLDTHFQQHPDMVFLLGTPHPTLADVMLSATFSSSFLVDDPPTCRISEQYPHLIRYVERMTGWQGGQFTQAEWHRHDGEENACTGAGGTGSGGDDDENNNDFYADDVPESLNEFFAILAEVFPFLMSQCASFQAHMTGEGVRKLQRVPLGGPWKGCKGYLLSQMTDMKSLMIIDNRILCVHVRAQDLELAFFAAREVLDYSLDDFGFAHPNSKAEESPATALPYSKSQAGAKEVSRIDDRVKEAVVAISAFEKREHDEASTLENAGGDAKEVESEDAAAVPSRVHDRGETEEAFATTTSTRLINNHTWITDPCAKNVLAADDADFYHAFTKSGRKRYMTLVQHRDMVVSPGSATARMMLRSSVKSRLEVLRAMLEQMACPQYTLATVIHGRMYYVAVIPEYEVARVRQTRADCAQKP